MSLMRAVRAENLKVLGSKAWWILLVVLFFYTLMMSAMIAFFVGGLGDLMGGTSQAAPIDPYTGAQMTYSIGTSLSYVIPVIFGTLLITAEFRYRTLTPTFLATPNRFTVLFAKLIVAKLYGLLFGVVTVIASVVPGALIFAAQGVDTQLSNPDILWMLVRMVIAMIIWSILGLGLGSVFTNQITAIVLLLVFTQFVEPILRLVASLWEWSAQLGQYLPGAASDALVGAGILSQVGAMEMGGTVQALDWWAGGLVLLALALLLVILGYFTSWRKDIS